ncbi:Accelerated cell death 11 [Vitis vinifera]|uniref:Accelerated cell death 11 n=1 Tax=Vitis vinifera TaxID=29760 RepID=A0A438ED51_VITVI|nr:Accelerated cell death 11 [Vitis vinifera]
MDRKREKLLTRIADTMKELADCVNSSTPRLEVHRLVHGCRVGSTLVGYLGLPFKFAQLEFLSKVNDLNKGARADDTLETLIDREIEQNLAKKHYSSSRSLIRVKRSIIMLSVMFEQMVTRGGNSIVGAASKSYEKSFAAYHGWATRTAVFASLPALPTRAKLMKKLHENEVSMTAKMKSFVDSSAVIVNYIDSLFHSRELGQQLLELI